MSGSARTGCCCPEDEEQACCLPDGEGCAVMLPVDCLALGGTVAGQATCEPDPCDGLCPLQCSSCVGSLFMEQTGLRLRDTVVGADYIYSFSDSIQRVGADCFWSGPAVAQTFRVNGIIPAAFNLTRFVLCGSTLQVTVWRVAYSFSGIQDERLPGGVAPGLSSTWELPAAPPICPPFGFYPFALFEVSFFTEVLDRGQMELR